MQCQLLNLRYRGPTSLLLYHCCIGLTWVIPITYSRRLHRFWCKVCQKTRFHTMMCLLGSWNQNLTTLDHHHCPTKVVWLGKLELWILNMQLFWPLFTVPVIWHMRTVIRPLTHSNKLFWQITHTLGLGISNMWEIFVHYKLVTWYGACALAPKYTVHSNQWTTS